MHFRLTFSGVVCLLSLWEVAGATSFHDPFEGTEINNYGGHSRAGGYANLAATGAMYAANPGRGGGASIPLLTRDARNSKQRLSRFSETWSISRLFHEKCPRRVFSFNLQQMRDNNCLNSILYHYTIGDVAGQAFFHSRVRVRLLQGSRARTSHRPYYGRASPEDSAEHSRGDGLSSPCSGRCLARQDMRSLQQSYAHPSFYPDPIVAELCFFCLVPASRDSSEWL